MRIPWTAVEEIAALASTSITRESGSQVCRINHKAFDGLEYGPNRAFMHLAVALLLAGHTPAELKEKLEWHPKIIRGSAGQHYDEDKSDASLDAVLTRIWKNSDL